METLNSFDGLTFTWEFPRFSAHPSLNGLNNVVYNIEFILTVSDGLGHGAQIFESVGISEPDQENFKPFNLLTQRVVQEWVEQALGEEKLYELKLNLFNQIQNQIEPPTVLLNRPW